MAEQGGPWGCPPSVPLSASLGPMKRWHSHPLSLLALPGPPAGVTCLVEAAERQELSREVSQRVSHFPHPCFPPPCQALCWAGPRATGTSMARQPWTSQVKGRTRRTGNILAQQPLSRRQPLGTWRPAQGGLLRTYVALGGGGGSPPPGEGGGGCRTPLWVRLGLCWGLRWAAVS